MAITRKDLEDRLASLRARQADAEARIEATKAQLAALGAAAEESEFWLFEVAQREAQAQALPPAE